MLRRRQKYTTHLKLEAWPQQNSLWNMAGMLAMAKHPCFSPHHHRGASHAGRQADRRPLHLTSGECACLKTAFLSECFYERLSTHTHAILHPVFLCLADSLPSRSQQLFSLLNPISTGWLFTPYLCLNKRREVFSPPTVSRPPRSWNSRAACWSPWQLVSLWRCNSQVSVPLNVSDLWFDGITFLCD